MHICCFCLISVRQWSYMFTDCRHFWFSSNVCFFGVHRLSFRFLHVCRFRRCSSHSIYVASLFIPFSSASIDSLICFIDSHRHSSMFFHFHTFVMYCWLVFIDVQLFLIGADRFSLILFDVHIVCHQCSRTFKTLYWIFINISIMFKDLWGWGTSQATTQPQRGSPQST